MKLSRRKIEKYNSDGIINVIVTALQIKSAYKNSTIYNLEASKTHQLLGIRKDVFRRHIGIMIERGDASMTGKNLTIKKLWKLDRKDNDCFVNLSRKSVSTNTRKHTNYILYGLLMQSEASKQQQLIGLKLLSNSKSEAKTLEDAKKAQKAFKSLIKLGVARGDESTVEVDEDIKFSNNSLLSITGVSLCKLYCVMNYLLKIKKMERKRNIKYLGNIPNIRKSSFVDGILTDRYGNAFFLSANIYKFNI